MNKSYKIIQESDEFRDNDKYYWGYQYRLSQEVLNPYLTELKAFSEGYRVAEIGCAEGGVLAAFVEGGAKNALGTDISKPRIDIGKRIADKLGLPLEFHYHDIINDAIPADWLGAFDLILLRDVIEHLDFTETALANIRRLLKPGGFLFVTFPPFHSPFGGHQHTVNSKPGMLPYIHLLPKSVLLKIISGGRENDIGEVLRLRKIRLTPKKFEYAANSAEFEIYHRDFYLLRPVFKMKFGLPALKITPLASLPFIKNYLTLEACYILRNKNA
ncbi:MAG: hypothetical protein QG635_52 [Bacteroidota bacterium]|nr:hypothetical protein [Bacteroidota bacterium]